MLEEKKLLKKQETMQIGFFCRALPGSFLDVFCFKGNVMKMENF